jgi:hypothetical protein
MNTALSTAILTMSTEPTTISSPFSPVVSSPSAAPPLAEPPLIAPPPAAHRDGPRSSEDQARHGAYLQSAVHFAITASATHMLDKVRTGFSRWASSTYSNKLIKRRKITGEQATVLNEREEAYTEHGNGAEARAHSISVKMDLAAAWTYHVHSYTNAGKTEPVVRKWKQSHLATTAPQAAATGVSTDISNTAAVPAPAQQRPSTQGEDSKSKRSGERSAHHEDSPGTDDDGGDDSPGGSPGGGGSTPQCKLWRCTSRVRFQKPGRKTSRKGRDTRRCATHGTPSHACAASSATP